MTLDEVRNVLLRHLTEGPNFDSWWKRVLLSHTSQRLAICLAIDLELRAIGASDVDAIINSVPEDGVDIAQHFADSIDRHPERQRLRGVNERPYKSLDNDSYARVMQLASFVTHYLADFEYGLDHGDLDEVREQFFPDDILNLDGGTSLGYVRSYWTGRNDIIWVSTYSELLHTAKQAPHRMGGVVNDALGLNYSTESDTLPVLVAVRYPIKGGPPCSKPNTFVADWRSAEGYYLSSSDPNEWGMTESCTGSFAGQRERVHDPIHGLSSEFVGFYIGEVDKIVGNIPRLIHRGMLRLEACSRKA